MSLPSGLRLCTGISIKRGVYYCPKCDRTLPKERVQKADKELRSKYGIDKLSSLRCPVCDTEYIDLDKVKEGGKRYVGDIKKQPGPL